jgi:hypothetical protein
MTDENNSLSYQPPDDIDFSVVTMGWRRLALFENDLYLGMQGMNVGMTDAVITDWEYSLLREYIKIEKTPTESALHVSAFSQMWTLAVYEMMRIWRDRVYRFRKWHENTGIDQAITNLADDDPLNMTKNVLRKLLERFRDEATFRERSDYEWQIFEPVFRTTELLRMNLAKHAAPGKESVIPRAPGYGRINMYCGAMDYEVVDRNQNYYFMNRRDIAEGLRDAFAKLKY